MPIFSIRAGDSTDATDASGTTGSIGTLGGASIKLDTWVGGFVNATNFISGYTTIVTAGGTTSLSSTTNNNVLFTGSTTQAVVLPNATTLVLGTSYYLNNLSSGGGVAVNTFGGGALASLPIGGYTRFILITNGTSAGTWDYHPLVPKNSLWGSAGLNTAGYLQTSSTINLQGSSSGVITIQSQAASGTFNYNLPITPGSSGQVLTSAGGGSSAMTWSSPVTSVAVTVPTFLTVSGSPITTTGTIAITLSGTALPVLNGGTGTTTSTGTGNTVLSASPTLTGTALATNITLSGTVQAVQGLFLDPTSGLRGNVTLGHDTAASFNFGEVGFNYTSSGNSANMIQIIVNTASSGINIIGTGAVVVPGSFQTPILLLTGSSSGTISILPQATAGTFNYNLPITAGTTGYFLTSGGGGSAPMTWTQAIYTTSYTPVLTGSSTAGTSTYTNQQGYYSRIGNVVTVSIAIAITATTSTGDLQISLPFTSNGSTANYGSAIMGNYVFPAGTTSLASYIGSSSTNMIVFSSGTSTGNTTVKCFNGTCNFNIQTTYFL